MPKIVDINTETLLDLAERNLTQAEMAELTGCSIPTLQKRLDDLKEKQGLLLKARDLRALRLTELQMMVLDAITPTKIAEAPLRDLVLAFKVLADRENVDVGKPTEMKGLVHYLVQIEKEKVALSDDPSTHSQSVVRALPDAGAFELEAERTDLEYIPQL